MRRSAPRVRQAAEAKPVESLSWRRHAARILAIWGLLFLAYSNSFHAGLVFDNASIIGEDPRIREVTPSNLKAIVHGKYWYGESPRGAMQFRPLTTLTYLLNYAVLGNGDDPAGYHWLNLLLHALNAAFVYALAMLLFRG